ncbi:MAG TPA: glycosyltransferase [Chitinophagales bacterium]|nr:glycosyltransferase [Chitinophagales bacterium]
MEVLFILFIVMAVIQLLYLLVIFRCLAIYKQPVQVPEWPPVSVIICARNESVRLERNLPQILEQEYPEFEVVVVNDNSQDESELLLMRLAAKYPRLVVRTITQESNIMQGKKYPLTVGIRAAKNEVVLLTDADCVPAGKQWIRDMAAVFSTQTEIVLGYAPYRKYAGFINKYIRYETFMTGLCYLSFALAGIPYMGVGRNLAYRKRIFFNNNVFPKHPHLISGDDDLLINKAATNTNTIVQISNDSFMFSEPKKSWDEYWEQKRRHVSTGRYYKFSHMVLLGLFSLTHLLFYCLFVLVMMYSSYQVEALALFGLRLLVQGIIFRSCMKNLGEKDLYWYFPVMDILFLIYYLKLFPDVFQNKQAAWK